MIEYRPFHNADPPQIVALWEGAGLGRGAVECVPMDAFETLNFAQPYFDPEGLILAVADDRAVGFVHAGFGSNPQQSALDRGVGVICAVVVHPEFRRRSIGRELVRRAENYLRSRGAATVFAGPAAPRDPFFFGLYGGSQPCGFLTSDAAADPFFTALSFRTHHRHAVFQRDLTRGGDPMSLRLMSHRRKMQLGILGEPENRPWWWTTRFGRLDTIRFLLQPKGGERPVAAVTAMGLDLYLPKWQQRAIGLSDLTVLEAERRRGYGQALLVEVCRRMRDEMVTTVETTVPEHDERLIRLLEGAGFRRIDTGIVYEAPGP